MDTHSRDEPDYRRSGSSGLSVSNQKKAGELVATSDPIELAADILSAFVSRNSVPRVELAALFEGLHASLKRLTDGDVAPPGVDPPTPAVSIRKSVTPDYLICLDDGLKFKSLRRHLTKLGMTPEQYRQKWDLPSDYPMVASNYAAQRSALAKNIGLGQSRKKPVVPTSADTIEVVAPDPASFAKSNDKAKARSKVVGTPPPARVPRKPGRPRKLTA